MSRPRHHTRPVTFDPTHTDDLTELARALTVIEDWLLHTGFDVLDELARFAYPHAYDPHARLGELIDYLGHASLALHRHTTHPTGETR